MCLSTVKIRGPHKEPWKVRTRWKVMRVGAENKLFSPYLGVCYATDLWYTSVREEHFCYTSSNPCDYGTHVFLNKADADALVCVLRRFWSPDNYVTVRVLVKHRIAKGLTVINHSVSDARQSETYQYFKFPSNQKVLKHHETLRAQSPSS